MMSLNAFINRAQYLKQGESIYASIPVTICEVDLAVDDEATYPGCADDTCMARMIKEGEGRWRCRRCGCESVKIRYRLKVALGDCDCFKEQRFIAFDGVAEEFLGMTAASLVNRRNRCRIAMTVLDRVMELGLSVSCRGLYDLSWEIISIVRAPLPGAPPPVTCHPSLAKDSLYMGEC